MKRKPIGKTTILIVLASIFSVIFLYYGIIILQARSKTRLIVATVLASPQIRLRLSDMTREQITILLKVEDPSFYTHNGFDFSTPGAGKTTITQGLVKIHYFDKFSPGIAKIEQTLIAWLALNALVSKEDQLTLFINEVYLGVINAREIHGFADAAEFYYHKSFTSLSRVEYISLVAMCIGPDEFNLIQSPDKNARRVARIEKYLSGEYIPKDNADVYYDQ